MAGRGVRASSPLAADRVGAWSALAVSAVSELPLALVSEARYSGGDRRAALVFDALGSAPDARAYFLFDGKKKVAKEKATPRSAPGCARSLALLGAPGGCGTRPCVPQTVLADFPRHACVAQRLSGGPKKASLLNGQGLNLECFRSARFSGPLGRRRATQALADKGRALSEGQSPELRSPRQRRVAQGTRAAGADLGSPSSLATFFLAKQEESTPARQARKPALQTPKPTVGQPRNRAPQKPNTPTGQQQKTALQQPNTPARQTPKTAHQPPLPPKGNRNAQSR